LSVQPAPAEQSLRRSLALQPGSIEALVALGRVLYLLRRHEEAREALERVLTLALGHPAAHYHLGEVLTGLDQLDQAEEHLRLALAAEPNVAATHNALACSTARLRLGFCRAPRAAGMPDRRGRRSCRRECSLAAVVPRWRKRSAAAGDGAAERAAYSHTLPRQVSVSRTAMRERIRIGFFSGDF
jgi:tetratricopeptide (TPR) repeat protein